MKKVVFADVTLKYAAGEMSFREKIEVAKNLDRIGIGVIEMPQIQDTRIDTLLIKSVAGSVERAVISVPAALSEAGIEEAWNAVKEAKNRRISICVPMSPVRMEYICKKKAPIVREMVKALTEKAAAYDAQIEFVADDATRSEFPFLCDVIRDVIAAGADVVTVQDTAGIMMPREMNAFVAKLKADVPELSAVTLGVQCSNQLSMSCAGAVEAIQAGAQEIKCAVDDQDYPLIEAVQSVIRARTADLAIVSDIDVTQMNRTLSQIKWMSQQKKSKTSPFENGVRDYGDEPNLSVQDDVATVSAAIRKLGYDLSDDDTMHVYEAFRNIVDKKEVSLKELDAIVANNAMQVPATYHMESYVVNTGNQMGSTAHVRLRKDDARLESVVVGDGPIDAAFLAIEQIVGQHYELDDFQIQSVTEGHEAMGAAMIRLRAQGKLYAGRGISTDIIGACIRAYLNALNKIVFEEG